METTWDPAGPFPWEPSPVVNFGLDKKREQQHHHLKPRVWIPPSKESCLSPKESGTGLMEPSGME
eukprot:12922939-Prorocentrum_lima.AAC.1